MATRSSIFPSLNEDRVYFAEDFLARPSRDFLAGLGDGVSREVGNSLEVTETDPASLAVDVDTGACRGDGWRFEVHTDKEEVSLDAADPSDDRIDRIIVRVRLGSSNRDAILTKLTGTPAGSPSAPALTRSGDTYEISLAQVLVGAGVTSVSDGDITDERGDTDVCGWLRAQDSKLLDGNTPQEVADLAQPIAGVESLDDTDFPKTLTVDDAGKLFIVDLSGAGAGAILTLPAEATAGDGWGVRVKLIGIDSGFKLNIFHDGGSAVWHMNVAGQLIHPVTDGTSWFNANPGAILNEEWITTTGGVTHTYAKGAVVAEIEITGSGAGGNGGNESSDISSSSGGAGETRIGRISGFGASDTVTIGAGGAGGAAGGVGSDGNASSWGTFFTANGGDTGGGGAGGAGGTGGSGGQGIPGGGGYARLDLENAPGMPGGSSFWGAGTAGGFHNDAGADGSLGGGGASGGESDQPGGDGGDGVAHIVEYA